MVRTHTLRALFVALSLLTVTLTHAEDGSRLWLRYHYWGKTNVECNTQTPTTNIAIAELQSYWRGQKVVLQLDNKLPKDGSFRIETNVFDDSKLKKNKKISKYKAEGKASLATPNAAVRISAGSDIGLLYGAYELLRQQACGQIRATEEHPAFQLRLLNHWDNPDGSIERGYAGTSIFEWFRLDKTHIKAYARANASLGINGSVLNNVNAAPKMLTQSYLAEVAKIADILRPYGIRVFLSVNFGAPKALGDLPTADPLNDEVVAWWTKKANEIYALIPDFGGFLVKANSEGQPGPGDYLRTHADGANMLARTLQPHGGIVMWRSFVYGANHKGEDRVCQAVSEFKPLDGKFEKNVILQSKNGPLDFQPREPYAPIFDNITQTPQMVELQVTQEYTGQSRHLVYLAPMWKEFFSFVSPQKLTGIAGVANIGNDKNWCGHHFSQANWYAFGRLAWNPSLTSEQIATEWLQQTFDAGDVFVEAMRTKMMESREACVDYMMPLGLHHIFAFDHHYGPDPGGFKPEYPIEWCPPYYHKADSVGLGSDRTEGTGTGAVAQYREPYRSLYANPQTCPENLLLWFHHVAWDKKLNNGKTLWQNLCQHYNHGCAWTQELAQTWDEMKPYVDNQRWSETAERIEHQRQNADEWRRVCLEYFATFSRMSIENDEK